MNKKLITVGGYCAAGKSVFADKLSQHCRIPCFSKDTLKETLADSIGKAHPEVTGRLSYTVFDLMLHLAQKTFIAGCPLILESNFKPAEIQRLESVAKAYGYNCLTFVFTGDLKTLFDRYNQREKSGKRHWVHIAMDEKYEDWLTYIPPLAEYGLGQTIRIDTTHFEAVDFNALLKTAYEFIYGA